MEIVVRKAQAEDIEGLVDIIAGYAQSGIMLPRSQQVIEKQLDTFAVAVQGERVIGCGSLFQLGAELVEIRSLGVIEGFHGRGIGKRLVEYLIEEARKQKLVNVMALTYEVDFFIRNGFSVVQKEIFPEKVWTDCVHCKKQNNCDEIAVLKRLE